MLRQNGRHFADIFKCIFFNENVLILIKISLKFIPKGPINNIPAFIGSDNGMVPTRRQAIIWTNDGYTTDQYVITILGNVGKSSVCMAEIKWNFRLIKIIDCIDELWFVI